MQLEVSSYLNYAFINNSIKLNIIETTCIQKCNIFYAGDDYVPGPGTQPGSTDTAARLRAAHTPGRAQSTLTPVLVARAVYAVVAIDRSDPRPYSACAKVAQI